MAFMFCALMLLCACQEQRCQLAGRRRLSALHHSLLKAAPPEVHEVLLRLYNACLRLKVTPSA